MENTFEMQDTLLTVKPTAHLDTATVAVLEKEMQPYLEEAQDVVMDFIGVNYISSSGLRMLLMI